MMRRTLIELGIAFLLLAAVSGAYAFWFAALDRARADAAALARDIATKSQDAARVAEAKQALAALAADEASMKGYLVRQEDIVPFLGSLEAKGSGLGAVLEVVSVSAEPSAGRGRILLSVKITGSFDAVLRTLGAIEHGPYDSAVVNVTLDTSAGDADAANTWSAVATFAVGTRLAQ